MELGERKQHILAAIVHAYIHTGEPVGSKTVMDMLDNAASSATIRNEMAELSALGYLEQPHTSAGRIPTAAAFRLYIDHMMPRHPLDEQDRQSIDKRLGDYADNPERLVEEASQELASSTGCAAVTTTPSEQGSTIRRIDLMRVSPRSVALLLVTATGMLRSRVCRFEADVPNEALALLADTLTTAFGDRSVNEVTLPQVQSLLLSLGDYGLLCAPALTSFYELVQEFAEADVLLAGQLNLLQYPDYERERARLLLNFLSRRQQVADMLAAHSGGLRVVLGSESRRPELSGSSIIVTRYTLGGKAAEHVNGSIGIIGPLRMDYAAAIPRIEYVAQTVGRLLTALFEEE